MSARSRADAVAFARQTLERTTAGLAAARERLAEFLDVNGLLSPALAAGTGSSQDAAARPISEARAQLQVMQASFSNRSAAPLRLQAERVAALEGGAARPARPHGRAARPARRDDAGDAGRRPHRAGGGRTHRRGGA